MFKSRALQIYLGGTMLALLIAGLAFVFMNQEQCPGGYTQAQVNASGCIVGANIGLGIALFVAGVVEVVSIITAVVVAVSERPKR